MSEVFQVILIDDERSILDLYEGIISSKGFEPISFTKPEEALSYINENHGSIALVISDFKMPNITGLTIREKMLEGDYDIPFALITGFYNKEMASEGMKLRICRFIEKPVDELDVIQILEKEAQERIESILEDREMVSEFIQETRPMLEEIEDLILSLEEDPEDSKAINTYFRLLHTIKGTSSCLGLTVLSDYAHEYENLITSIKNHELHVDREVIDILLKGYDQLKELYNLSENFSPFPADIDKRAEIFSKKLEKKNNDEPCTAKASEENVEDLSKVSETKQKKKEKEDKVTVSENLLSQFLEMSGEFTVIRNSIFKSLARLNEKWPLDKDLEQLVDSMGEMQKVSSILQNKIAEMKKVNIESVYRPMRRVVRDSCAVLDKNVNFNIQGDDLNVDTSVAKLLNSVLVHLLRNAVDHGIETKESREKQGKPAEGKILLNSFQTGEDIVVEVIDDGKGLDKEILKKKALEKSLYTERQLSSMSDQKIYSIIFESGFSTNDQVTTVSGRGVGMDMVKSSIEEVGGKILIDSEVGTGTKFILIIPIPRSILIIKSLIVKSKMRNFNIPLDDVDEVVLYEKGKKDQMIYHNHGTNILKHHDILCPLISLEEALGLSESTSIDLDFQNIVIVKGEGFRYGVLVDGIEDIEEIVVKKLSGQFDIPELLGTTFADDGALNMILDCKGIAKKYEIKNFSEDDSSSFLINKKVFHEEQEFMRFSLNTLSNCALPLDWVFRLEEIRTRDIQFSGNTAAVRYRNSSLPLIHVENLLGMTEESVKDLTLEDKILSVLVVKVKDKLYGAIIKELNDIATTSEKIDNKLVDREGILGTISIEEKIITVIDIESLTSTSKGILKFNNVHNNNDYNYVA